MEQSPSARSLAIRYSRSRETARRRGHRRSEQKACHQRTGLVMTVNVGGQSNADARLRDKFRPRHVRARSQRGRSGTGKTIGEPQLDIWHPPQPDLSIERDVVRMACDATRTIFGHRPMFRYALRTLTRRRTKSPSAPVAPGKTTKRAPDR